MNREQKEKASVLRSWAHAVLNKISPSESELAEAKKSGASIPLNHTFVADSKGLAERVLALLEDLDRPEQAKMLDADRLALHDMLGDMTQMLRLIRHGREDKIADYEIEDLERKVEAFGERR